MKSSTLLIVTLLFAEAGWGQGSKGIIVGNVTDASGGSVAGANVTTTNTDTGAQTKTTTNTSGFYQFVELSPGMYSVTVEAPGFAKTTVAPQRLVVASNLRVDVTLEIGKVSESVTVDETSPQVNTEDPQLGRSITDIASLPILSGNGGRNALSLIALQPGVTTTPSTGAQVPGAAVGSRPLEAGEPAGPARLDGMHVGADADAGQLDHRATCSSARAKSCATVTLADRSSPGTVATRTFVRRAHALGLDVHVWTINDRAEMIRYLDLGADGIMTDEIETLRDVLIERGQWHPRVGSVTP